MPEEIYAGPWTTEDECMFIRSLSVKNPVAFWRYAALVGSGVRRFDATVDMGRVQAEIQDRLGMAA